MAVFIEKTKNKIDVNKKPRVYFTCHPDDFEKYFKKLCDDIFKTHDCAIYYTEDMTEAITEKEDKEALDRINLVVVPVTYRLLTTPNRAMDEDIPYALKKPLLILPIMMESGLDEIYARPDRFGELQYLNSTSTDITEISYEEKLKKHLDAVLISDKLAKRVRAAFDAYIFLSYRKKDRRYANELMRLIHSNPECRDIAIWFDEFLTPGESFKENIESILNSCNLFTLLITPRILEKVIDKNGVERDNYVISTELPLARKNKEKNGTDIFAVEMEETDTKSLLGMNIQEYVNAYDGEFRTHLLEAVSRLAIVQNEEPEHNFLIGLAYLTGIDMEVNTEEGLRLIEDSAKAGLKEAMTMLVNVYYFGIGTQKDIIKAITYQRRCIQHLKEKTKKASEDLLEYLSEELRLAEMEIEADLLKEARNTCWRVLKQCKRDGRYGPFFAENRIEFYVRAYILLGKVFAKRDDVEQSWECYKKAGDTLNQLTEDEKGIVDIFVCGCVYYHLGEIYSNAPFYDSRYTVSNFKKALLCFEQCEQTHSGQNLQTYIDNCKIKLAAEYERVLTTREDALRIYLELSDQYVLLDYQGSLAEVLVKAHSLYRLGVLYQKQKNIPKAKEAYQLAFDISSKAREYHGDNIDIMGLFLLSSAKLLYLNNGNTEEYTQLSVLAEAFGNSTTTRQARQMTAELYFELRNVDVGYLKKSYDIYETLDDQYPEFYSEDLYQFRNYMWKNKLLDESYFTKTSLIVLSQKNGLFCCVNPATQRKCELVLNFLREPSYEIQKMTITVYQCKGIYDDIAHRRMLRRHYPTTPLTQVYGIEPIYTGTPSDLIPDRFITFTYKNGETVTCIFG